jgi:hypothetical protein
MASNRPYEAAGVVRADKDHVGCALGSIVVYGLAPGELATET